MSPQEQEAQHQKALQHALEERERSHRLASWFSAEAASVERVGFRAGLLQDSSNIALLFPLAQSGGFILDDSTVPRSH